MNKYYKAFMNMGDNERTWVKDLVHRFGWSVNAACEQVYYFGICKKHVYDYFTDELIYEVV